MNKKSVFCELLDSFKWISFVSNRFSSVDKKGKISVTSTLASIGIGFGVMALIVVLSVMNGFQGEFIDAIMEISSYHIRVTDVENEENFVQWCDKEKNIETIVPFYEAQGLLIGKSGKQSAAMVRALPSNVFSKDTGFRDELKIVSGEFNLSEDNYIVLGYDLAKNLGVTIGNKINILALSGSSDLSLISNDREFIVTGIFYCGYSDINNAYSFIQYDNNKKIFGSSARTIFGIKLNDENKDSYNINRLNKEFVHINVQSWQNYNRGFFGVLRMEKNLLMMMVLLIFLVVAVNIYNGMKRIVYERKEDIAILSAFGANHKSIQTVFIYKGFLTGLKGALPGLIGGIFLSINIDKLFLLVSKIQYYFQLFLFGLINPDSLASITENPMFSVYASIPAKMKISEIIIIFFFGIFSSLIASWIASKNVLKMTISEILRDE